MRTGPLVAFSQDRKEKAYKRAYQSIFRILQETAEYKTPKRKRTFIQSSAENTYHNATQNIPHFPGHIELPAVRELG
jgi:hypothetical protein